MLPEAFVGKEWIIQAFAIILATLIVHFIIYRIYKKLLPKIKTAKNRWYDLILESLIQPLGWAIWVVGIAWAAESVAPFAGSDVLFSIIQPVRNLLLILLLSWFLLSLVRRLEKRLVSAKKTEGVFKDPTTIRGLCQILRAATIITAALIALQALDIRITGLLAFGGVGTIIIGLAAKDLLANFFGGLMIFLDRPFQVGDWISSPDKEIEGTVEDIGWRLTRIRTFDKRPLYVPNGMFSTISVQNPSRMSHRRIYAEICLRYQDSQYLAKILREIEAMLKTHPEIDASQTLMVHLIEFGEYALKFMVYTFTKTTEWVTFQQIQEDVFLKIIEIVRAHGADFASPRQPSTTLLLPPAGGTSS